MEIYVQYNRLEFMTNTDILLTADNVVKITELNERSSSITRVHTRRIEN